MNPANLKRNEFIKIFGSLYENSAFIAEEIFQIGVKKDHSYEDVLISMRAFVDEMKPKAKLHAPPPPSTANAARKAVCQKQLSKHSSVVRSHTFG